MKIKEAKEFEKKILDDKWNLIHSKSIIKILKLLKKEGYSFDLDLLAPLAYVHDIGKAVSDKDHAIHSLNILGKKFELNKIEKDCILNHGSSSSPVTPEGEIFRFADGLSLFTKESVNYFIQVEGIKKTKVELLKLYGKYKIAYKSNRKILEMLEKAYLKKV
ncbi:HD domain-containing protein [Candidatus Woesearchaeota archaeon]|nr:HD domain-containing protein [Candidatus Woesearchaeota archaeon]